jgi:hypothetical protein
MKKILIAIVALVYMTVSTGIAMELHYCMGRFAGADVFGARGKACTLCGMTEKKNGCCHDEYKFVKLEDSHKNVLNCIDFAPSQIEGNTTVVVNNFIFYDKLQRHNPYYPSPPFYSGPPLHVLHSVFRI